MALIANNGTGKTSLLKIIAGKDVPNQGIVTLRKGIRIGYLEQQPDFNEDLSVKELIHSTHSEVMKCIHEYEAALGAQSLEYNNQTINRFEKASALMDELNGWDYDRRIKQVLSQFNINDLSQKIFLQISQKM